MDMKGDAGLPLAADLHIRSLPMPKFMFVYRDTIDSYSHISREEMQKAHQKWQSWIKEGFQTGWLLDAGNGLKTEGRVVNAQKIVTDGPFIEAKEIVGGYAIVQAATLDAAAEFAKGCPILLRGGTVEVRPLWVQD